ncbi:MAG: T9SS type A sorting domain-containing protein [Chitinophagales bacterium]
MSITRIVTITTALLLCICQLGAQAYLGQTVPDVTETDCNSNTESIYDVLETGKPLLVFKTDMICSNTTAWGTTVRQYADLYASQYRTWVCADFVEANSPSEQCAYMQDYEEQTGMNTNSVFRFIDTTSIGPYDPSSREELDVLCYQGYIVIGLDSTIIYLGNNVNEAVDAALNASQVTGVEQKDENDQTINIFPNPVTSILHIESNIDVRGIHIYNQLGQIVSQSQSFNTKTLDLSLLEKGVYFITIENKHGIFSSRKFLKL